MTYNSTIMLLNIKYHLDIINCIGSLIQLVYKRNVLNQIATYRHRYSWKSDTFVPKPCLVRNRVL